MSTKPAPLRRFMPYLLRYKGILLFDLFCAALTCICELVLPLMVRTVTNMGAENPAGLTVGFIVRSAAPGGRGGQLLHGQHRPRDGRAH